MFRCSIALSGNESVYIIFSPPGMSYAVIHDVTSLAEEGDFGAFKLTLFLLLFVLRRFYRIAYILVLN